MRAFTHHCKRVRPAGAYRHLFARFDDPRAAYPLSNPQSSLMHEKPLFLPKMPVKRPAVPATTGTHVGAKQIAIRLEHCRA